MHAVEIIGTCDGRTILPATTACKPLEDFTFDEEFFEGGEMGESEAEDGKGD
jgi:hypothetical protein